MKKIFAVMLALAMLLSVAAFAEEADFQGVWYLVEMQGGGESYTPADFGVSMTMELKEDGTAQSDSAMGGEVETDVGTWAMEGDAAVVTINDTPVTFSLQDGMLVATEDEMTMIFSREEPEVEIYTPAAVVDVEPAAFEGNWIAVKYGFDGTYVDAAAVGMDMTAEFNGSELLLTGMLGSDTPFQMTFDDAEVGAYHFFTEDESQMITAIEAEMLEDGNLMVTLTVSGDMILIMAPAEAVEEPAA